jgi:carbon-monoxide dehydrogenase medium subunit
VKAARFDYERATSVVHALELLKAEGADACVIAGGQSLLPALNARVSSPSKLIDIAGIAELRGVELRGDRLRIGALTRHADILRHPLIARHAPLLSIAAHHIAHPAIRNRGTIGGSLALADPAAEWPACVTALDAEILVAGQSGERRVAARDFFQGIFTVDLAPGELIVAIDAPIAGADETFAFDEVARRRGDFAIAGIAARWRPSGAGLRLVFFGVADRPQTVDLAAAAVLQHARAGALAPLLDQAVAGLDPADDPFASSAYRLHLARILAGRIIARVVEGSA